MSDPQEETGLTEQERISRSQGARRKSRQPMAKTKAEAEARKAEAAGAEDKGRGARRSVFQTREAASLCLPIHRRFVGFLIGREGSTIKAIQQLTGTRLSIKEERNRHTLYIYGNYKACERAQDVVECVLGWCRPAGQQD